MDEIMIPVNTIVDRPALYIAGLIGIYLVEQRFYNTLVSNGKTRWQKWKSERIDDLIAEIGVTAVLIYGMNYIWYFIGYPFTWSNVLTSVLSALISVPTAWFVMDLLPTIFGAITKGVLGFINRYFNNKNKKDDVD